ncbi:hypothetical protein ACHWQZ_G000850 [Mnemiopsis leidyi]
MSLEDQDRIDNFQRYVLLARAKIDQSPDFRKSKDFKSDVSPQKTRKKKSSSETASSEAKPDFKKSNDFRSDISPQKTRTKKCSSETATSKEKPVAKKMDSKLSSKKSNTKAPRHASPTEKEISPSSKAPDQKKRKCLNTVANESCHDISNQQDYHYHSNQYTHSNESTENDGHNNNFDSFRNLSSMRSPVNIEQPKDNIIQELQDISAQLISEAQSCKLSPMQSRMTYGESRYIKPSHTLLKDSNSNCLHDKQNSDYSVADHFIGPQLASPDYPAAIGPPGIAPPTTANPFVETPRIFYREQPISGRTSGVVVNSQNNSGQCPPGFGPYKTESQTRVYPIYDHSRSTANGQYSKGAVVNNYMIQPTAELLTREPEPSFPRDEKRSQDFKGLNYNRNPYANRAAVSDFVKYFEPETSSVETQPESFINEQINRSSEFVGCDKFDKVKHPSFIGKHPSMMKKVYHRDFNKENMIIPPENDSDGEVHAILSGPHKPSFVSDSFKTAVNSSSHSNFRKSNVIPTFTQLNDNSREFQFKTPPNRQSTSRVQDGRWSLGSVESRGSDGDSPAGRAARHSSPSKNKYTGKPLSSKSSPVSREVKISKALTGICRHRRGSGERLMMLEGGYFSVEEILNTTRFKQMSVTREEVEDIVRNNDKQRFSLKDLDGNLLICANQGHSIEVKGLELEKIHSAEGYTNVVHGTYEEAWEFIKIQGLSRMNRTHIHFALGLPSNRQVISGMRSDCEVVIYIDMKAALRDGYEFYRSKNNVILCSGDDKGYLPPKYFTSVIRLKGRRELLHETKSVVPGFHAASPSTSPYKPNTTSTTSSYYKDTGYTGYPTEADRSSNWRRSS